MIYTVPVITTKRTEFINITAKVQQVVQESAVKEGMVVVFVPHTTAGLTINENADPDVVKDILAELNKVIPFDDGYLHLEGNSAAHIKASLMGSSQQIIITNGKLLLGTWQGLFFGEFDGPRQRKVYIKVISV